MLVRRVFQPVRLLWLAPALLGTLMDPGAARASCGDHVRATASGSDTGRAALDLSNDLFPASANPVPLDDPLRPCTGPSCSRRTDRPTPPPPPAPQISSERGLVGPSVETPRLPEGRCAAAQPPPVHAPPTPDRPDRPPRA